MRCHGYLPTVGGEVMKPRESASATADSQKHVKSMSPIQQDSVKNGYDENNHYNKSDENKCETNYSIITNINKWNVNTHNNMQLTMHNKYTNDDVDSDECVVHIMR